jgi:hypothetical protein
MKRHSLFAVPATRTDLPDIQSSNFTMASLGFFGDRLNSAVQVGMCIPPTLNREGRDGRDVHFGNGEIPTISC